MTNSKSIWKKWSQIMRNVALTQMLKNQHNQDADEMMIMKSKIPLLSKVAIFLSFNWTVNTLVLF